MWAVLAILIVVVSTVGYLYLKATFLKSFMMLMASLLACIITFTYFEKLAGLLLGYGYGGQWTHPVVFVLLFLLTFAILTAIIDKLIVQNILFGDRLDLAGRVFFGLLLGFFFSGMLLITVGMMPIPAKWPYERFEIVSETTIINPDAPKKVLLNPDGFVAGLYSWISQGSLSGKKSFAVFHADYIDQLHLNRSKPKDSEIIIITGADSLRVKAAWEPLAGLTDSADNKPLAQNPGTRHIVVRAAIKSGEIKEGGAMDDDGIVSFTLAQIRLICKSKDQVQKLTGSAKVVPPVGYIKIAGLVENKSLAEEIKLNRSDFSGGLRWFDFVFNVPSASVPVLLEFKQNAVANIPPMAVGDKIPEQL
jgi:hypothetical protein